MPWLRGKFPPPSLDLATAARRIIGEVNPVWWCVENVCGAVKWLTPLLGCEPRKYGQAFLWGTFPDLGRISVRPHKERLSSRRRAERSKIPYEISLAMARACEGTIFVLGDC